MSLWWRCLSWLQHAVFGTAKAVYYYEGVLTSWNAFVMKMSVIHVEMYSITGVVIFWTTLTTAAHISHYCAIVLAPGIVRWRQHQELVAVKPSPCLFPPVLLEKPPLQVQCSAVHSVLLGYITCTCIWWCPSNWSRRSIHVHVHVFSSMIAMCTMWRTYMYMTNEMLIKTRQHDTTERQSNTCTCILNAKLHKELRVHVQLNGMRVCLLGWHTTH